MYRSAIGNRAFSDNGRDMSVSVKPSVLLNCRITSDVGDIDDGHEHIRTSQTRIAAPMRSITVL